MSQRHEFVLLAQQAGANIRRLCRRFNISATTAYRWITRFEEGGAAALADRSRRPRRSPKRSPDGVVAKVLAMHEAHPTWGGRKIRDRLLLEASSAPAASTCTAILKRHGLLPSKGSSAGPWQRFTRDWPNELWQIDHKGDFATQSGQRCQPLTVTDDHSRFNVALGAHADRTGPTVQAELEQAFQLYGLPAALLCDNGPPWGCADPVCPYTKLTVWLLRLGVRVLHGRPYHPETQGKAERFHRTLNLELISQHTWRDVQQCGERFARYRQIYNCERPHDELGGVPPITRYRPSPRAMPEQLPPLEYAADCEVRVLRAQGHLMLGGQTWYVGTAFAGLPIGLRPCPDHDGRWDVLFAHHTLGRIDLTTPHQPKHTLRSIYTPKRGEADRLPCTPSTQSR